MLKDFSADDWNGNTIIIYGAGTDGNMIASGLIKSGIEDFVFCDSNKKEKELLNKSIYNTSIITEKKDFNIILGSSRYCVEIYKILKDLGVKEDRIYTAKKCFFSGIHKFESHALSKVPGHYRYEEGILRLNAYINGGWCLPHLDITITERCTLKCKACCSLVPLYKTPHNCDYDIVLKSFDKLLSSNCYISTVNLMGGEPLLNQELIQKILLRYKDEQQIGSFQIITNGTILPNEKTLEAMKINGRVYVIFSNYGQLSKMQEKAVESLERNNIEVVLVEEDDIKAENNTLWIDYGEVRHYEFSREKHQRMFENCKDAKGCTTLMNGKLFICTRIAHGVNLGLIPEDLPHCYVEMLNYDVNETDEEKLRKECIDLLNCSVYPLACEYCNRDAGILVKRAEQVKSFE